MRKKRIEQPCSLRKKVLIQSVADDEEIIQKVKEEQIRISTNLEQLDDYGPQYYKTEWNKHYRVLKQSDDGDANPLNWNVDQVSDNILKICHSEDIANRFKEQEVDGTALLDLSKEDLHNLLSIKLGPSIKISHFVDKLRRQVCEQFIILEHEDEEFGRHLQS